MKIKQFQFKGLYYSLYLLLLIISLECGKPETNPFDPLSDNDPPVILTWNCDNGSFNFASNENVRSYLCLGYAPQTYTVFCYETGARVRKQGSFRLLGNFTGMTLFYKLVITDLAGNETESEENKFIPAQAYEDSLLRLVMIDVGWGDALYFETPGQVNALIDSGHNSGGYNHLGDVLRFLNTYKEQKITAINHGVMTHLHSDHADGFVYGLLGAIKFDDFLDAEPHIERYYQQGDYLSEYYGELLDILHEQQIKRITPKTDQKFEWDTDVEIKVLNAGNPFSDDNENHSSLVLKIKYRNFHLLLTGDAEEPNESRILSQYGSIVESEVLKVGHHGNDDASSQSFIDAVSPVVALVPVDPQEVEGALPDKIIIDRIKTSGAHVFESNSASPLNSLTLHADVEVLSDGYFFTVILDSE